MTIKERICKFIDYKKMNVTRFQQSIGVSGSYIANMTKGIGVDVQRRIIDAYPELNIDWILTGEGNMLNEPVSTALQKIINVMPLSASGGHISEFMNNTAVGCEVMTAPSEHSDVAILIPDDSMEPLLKHGVRAVLQRTNADAFIAWGNVYVIDTVNGIYVRHVYPSVNYKDGYLLKSCNEKYPDFEIKSSHVLNFYKILATINIF